MDTDRGEITLQQLTMIEQMIMLESGRDLHMGVFLMSIMAQCAMRFLRNIMLSIANRGSITPRRDLRRSQRCRKQYILETHKKIT